MPLPPPAAGRYRLGDKSLAELATVDPNMQRVVRRAITMTEVDFLVNEGKRTAERQMVYFLGGTSQLNGIPKGQFGPNRVRGTGLSNHQSGRAVDLVAWVGHPTWEPWDLYYGIALAMKRAAAFENVQVTWGGAWDTPMHQMGNDMRREVEAYANRRRKSHPGRKILLDGPHFELIT